MSDLTGMMARQADMMQQFLAVQFRQPTPPQAPMQPMMPAYPQAPRQPQPIALPPGMDPDLANITQTLLQILQPQLDGIKAEVGAVNQGVALQQQMEQQRLQMQQQNALRQQWESLIQSLSKPTADGQQAVAPVFANPLWGQNAIWEFSEALDKQRWRNPADVAREVQQTYDMRITQTVQAHVTQPQPGAQAFPGGVTAQRAPAAPTAGSNGGPLIVLPEPRDTRDVAAQAKHLRAQGVAIPSVV